MHVEMIVLLASERMLYALSEIRMNKGCVATTGAQRAGDLDLAYRGAALRGVDQKI